MFVSSPKDQALDQIESIAVELVTKPKEEAIHKKEVITKKASNSQNKNKNTNTKIPKKTSRAKIEGQSARPSNVIGKKTASELESRSEQGEPVLPSKDSAKPLSLSQLVPKYEAYGSPGSATKEAIKEGRSDNIFEEWGAGGGSLERMTHPLLMRSFYEYVSNLTYYPGVLARRNMSGTVYARIVLDKQNGCDWTHTWIKSREKYFRIYVLSILKKACRQDFSKLFGGKQQLNVDLAFTFAITEGLQTEFSQYQNRDIGNTLLLYRNAHKSKLEWSFGPFKGLFPYPVVNIDFVWLKENWDKYMEGKADPVDRFENSTNREIRLNSD